MADNVTLNTMSGGDTIAADDIAGIKWQRMKMGWGADGAAVDVSTTAPLPVTTAAATSIGSGALTLATAGTATQLPNQAALGLTIRALGNNTGTIYVGGSAVTSTNGFPLGAGESVSLDVANLNTVYVNAGNNNDGVRYIWVAP
jgi:hypothetical protein